MKSNVGNIDRIIRIVIALIIAILYFAKIIEGTAGIILLVVAGVLVVSAAIGFCGLYTVFGISTCSRKNKE